MQSDTLLRVGCLPDCGYEAESRDRSQVIEEMTTHMWEAHRLPIDPLDVREMVRPSQPRSRGAANASASADSHVSRRS